MKISQIKEIAKKSSKEVLFDAIYNNRFSEDELVVFRDEVKNRGLEAELAEMIKIKEINKNRIKQAVNKLSKEDLFAMICYNPYQFTEQELVIFKNEVKARGCEEELAEVIKTDQAKSIEFKTTVLDVSQDPVELLKNFNAYNEKEYSFISAPVNGNEIKKRKAQSLSGFIFIAGAILILIGIFFTITNEGSIIFYGAILTGIILIAKGIITGKS